MFALALFILVGSIAALRYKKIEAAYGKSKLLVLLHQHLLAASAMGGASYLGTGHIVWLTVGMLTAIMTATLWTSCEFIHVLKVK